MKTNKEREKLFYLGFAGKKIVVENYEICTSFFSKLRGLMFRPRNFKTPLFFVFKKPVRYPIHSFFCKRFLAIWFLNKETVEKRIIKPWESNIYPSKEFDSLLEIPLN